MKDTIFSPNLSLNFKGILRVYKHPIVMAIINTTPDSFYDKSRHNNVQSCLEIAKKMIDDGAEILDIGGYSSRPGAIDISIDEEINRVVPVITALKQKFPDQIISIDTFRTEVAEAAIDAGATMINDITGGFNNTSIYELAAKAKTPYIMMHMRGTPQDMQSHLDYNLLTSEILQFFSTQINIARASGLIDIIIDPGIGFSKSLDQNYELIKNLKDFLMLNQPILIGVSRKSLLYKLLNITPDKALNATTSLNTIAILNGAKNFTCS